MSLQSYFEEQLFSIISVHAYKILLALLICVFIVRWLSRPKLNLPKGPTGLPLVGYLPFLGKEPHKTFDKLKEKYGNVFRVRLGQSDIVILADYAAVQEGLNKSATAYRPTGAFDFLPGGLGIGGASGPQWVEERRFAIKKMRDLGFGRTKWTMLIEEEISDFLNKIASYNGKPVDIDRLLAPSVANSIISLLFGKRLSGPLLDSLVESAAAISDFFGAFGLWNFFPRLCIILRNLKFTHYYKNYEKMKAFNNIIRNEIQNHKQTHGNDAKEMDFIAEYLQFLEDAKTDRKETLLNEKTMIGDAQTLFAGGSDTIRTNLHWLFLTIAAFPDVQAKVFNELDSVLKDQKILPWEDRTKLPYTTAVIIESQRWITLAPTTTPRVASEDIKIFDYDIPKGTIIIPNLWGLHNDTRYWKDPKEFIPERFLKDDGKELNTKTESYAPFSIGRRKCPGELVAMMELFLYFTSVMLRYEVRSPNGGKPDLSGTLGLVYMPNQRYLCFIPREQKFKE